MSEINFKKIIENLIPVFDKAGQESIDLYKRGLKIEMKDDNSPVSNGDMEVNKLITDKLVELTPDIPIISEETVKVNDKNDVPLTHKEINDAISLLKKARLQKEKKESHSKTSDMHIYKGLYKENFI